MQDGDVEVCKKRFEFLNTRHAGREKLEKTKQKKSRLRSLVQVWMQLAAKLLTASCPSCAEAHGETGESAVALFENVQTSQCVVTVLHLATSNSSHGCYIGSFFTVVPLFFFFRFCHAVDVHVMYYSQPAGSISKRLLQTFPATEGLQGHAHASANHF